MLRRFGPNFPRLFGAAMLQELSFMLLIHVPGYFSNLGATEGRIGLLGRDGGAVVSRKPELAGRVRRLREYGWTPQARYISQERGLNSRLDEMQAAILRAKLTHLDAWNDARRELAALYDRLLVEPVTTPVEAPGCRHVYHLYVVRTPGRDVLRAALQAAGIGTGIHYPAPVHVQPAYQGAVERGALPVTEQAARAILSLLGPSVWNIILVITLLFWRTTARVIRAQVLSLKERPFVWSARAAGAGDFYLLYRHILPNVLPLVLLYTALSVGSSVLTEAGLSFLGFGDPNYPSWGTMLNQAFRAGAAATTVVMGLSGEASMYRTTVSKSSSCSAKSRSSLEPNLRKRLRRLTPVAAAMPSMVVPSKPSSANNRTAASTASRVDTRVGTMPTSPRSSETRPSTRPATSYPTPSVYFTPIISYPGTECHIQARGAKARRA